MSKPLVKIINATTGEEIEREMTKSEYEQFLADEKLVIQMQLGAEAKQAARQSALEKLAALGLTEAEIQALAG